MEFAELILIPKLDNVILHGPYHDPVDGTLCITGHHLILSSRKEGVQELWILHQSIDLIEKKPFPNTNNSLINGGVITIKCKDLRIIQLEITYHDNFINVFKSIEQLSNITNITKLYPFFYRPMYNILEEGYAIFKPEIEYAKFIASDEWRISDVNKDYKVCPSYSRTLVVPKAVDDETIMAAACFRDGGRFPIISYKHENGSLLLRSSQPLVGNGNKRCRSDEKLLNSILGVNKRGYIVDTRSASFANICKTKGGGFELETHYPQWRRLHKSLDKITNGTGALLDSFSKLVEACNDTSCSMDKWLSRLDNSSWLSHILTTLNTSCVVAQCLDQENVSVLVHGSTGLDSTLIVTSLTQIILNPDCRTVRGFQALIEREWLQAGHPFSQRHSHSCYSTSQSGRTKTNQPSFLLFLDCVHQMHYQFPCSFEFTTYMLIQLFEHSYFSQFGTFLGNSESDRIKLGVPKATTSLWSYLNRPDKLTFLLNPMYEPNPTALWPSVAPISLVLWSELYLRWVVDQSSIKTTLTRIQTLKDTDKDLRSQVCKLRKELLDLHREYESLNSPAPVNCETVIN